MGVLNVKVAGNWVPVVSDAVSQVFPLTPTVRTFTANGTWTKPPGLIYAEIEVQGGGGAGGGAPVLTTSNTSFGGSGAAGGYAKKTYLANDLGATEAVVVGAGGTGVSGANGNNGGTSSFAGVSATGGAGGGTLVAAATTATRTLLTVGGGIGSGGDVNGNGGRPNPLHATAGGSVGGDSGGGQSFFGFGGGYGLETTGGASNSPGAGGGGMRNSGAQVVRTGGAGGDGVVIVTEYTQNMASEVLAVTLTPTVRTYTASGTWNKPAGLVYAEVEVQGGGGGSGGCALTAAAQSSAGAGGGGGGYSKKMISTSALGATETVTVGAGGVAGTTSTGGGAGLTSSFGAHCSATGGAAGGFSSAVAHNTGYIINEVAGGVGSGGDLNLQGGASRMVASSTRMNRPVGGTTPFAPRRGTAVLPSGAAGAFNGSGYGGGAGGPVNCASQGTALAGAAGDDGVVIVTEWVQTGAYGGIPEAAARENPFTPTLKASGGDPISVPRALRKGGTARSVTWVFYTFLFVFGGTGITNGSGAYNITVPVPPPVRPNMFNIDRGGITLTDAAPAGIRHFAAAMGSATIYMHALSPTMAAFNAFDSAEGFTFAAGDTIAGQITYHKA